MCHDGYRCGRRDTVVVVDSEPWPPELIPALHPGTPVDLRPDLVKDRSRNQRHCKAVAGTVRFGNVPVDWYRQWPAGEVAVAVVDVVASAVVVVGIVAALSRVRGHMFGVAEPIFPDMVAVVLE